MSQDFLLYLQKVLKEHQMESSLEELSAICSRYGIEQVEQLEPDTISGIYHTLQASRQNKKEMSVEGNSLVTLMKQKFQKKVTEDAKTIVEDYKNVPVEIQEQVIKTMMAEYVKKNPKLDEFLDEADYAKIAEENIQASQALLKNIIQGLFLVLVLIFLSNLLDSFGNLITKTQTKNVGVENVKN